MRLLLTLMLLLMTYEVSAKTVEISGSNTSNNNFTITRKLQISGEVGEIWFYVPKPVNTTYSTIWKQDGTYGTITASPASPAPRLFEFEPGVWVDFGYRYYQTVTVTTQVSATVSDQLSGINTDLARSSGGTWYRATARSPDNIPGLSTTMQDLIDYPVPGTAEGNLGLAERWAAWLHQNVTYNRSLKFSVNDATTVWTTLTANCSGFSSLFKAGLITVTPKFGVGIAIGQTVSKSFSFPSPAGPITISTSNDPHTWNVVDDGSQWVPFDATLGLFGMATTSRIFEGVFEDEADGGPYWEFSYEGETPPHITFTSTVSGSSSSSSYTHERSRNPYPGKSFAAHWIRNSSLAPLSDGYPTSGVPDPFLDTNKQNTFVISPNPAARWIQTQLFLERDADRVTVKVFNVAGQLVDTVYDGPRAAGYNYLLWEPQGTSGGVYYLRVNFNDNAQQISKKFVITD